MFLILLSRLFFQIFFDPKLKKGIFFLVFNFTLASINLSFFELLGDANGVNEEGFIYQKISCNDLILFASDVLIRNNCSLLKVAINDR